MSKSGNLTLPVFIGIGPARTGTTWLHEALQPVAWLPYNVKETRFFNQRYEKGIDWYAHHFRFADRSRPVGEVSPYFSSAAAIERIAEHIPDCRIVVTFRDPVERAYSFYRLMRRYVWTRASFEEALAVRRIIAEGNRYAHYLPLWQQRFGKDRVQVTFYEELIADQQTYLDRVCDFIGAIRVDLSARKFRPRAENSVERAPKNRKLAQNARHLMFWLQERRAYSLINFLERRGVWAFCYGRGDRFPPLSPEVEARVRAQFLPEVEALERIVGRDLSDWKKPRADRAVAPNRFASREARSGAARPAGNPP